MTRRLRTIHAQALAWHRPDNRDDDTEGFRQTPYPRHNEVADRERLDTGAGFSGQPNITDDVNAVYRSMIVVDIEGVDI